MYLESVLVLTNSAVPDKMPPYTAFCLGLYSLPKHLLYRYSEWKGLHESIEIIRDLFHKNSPMNALGKIVFIFL